MLSSQGYKPLRFPPGSIMTARPHKSRIACEATACDSRREAARQGPAVLFEWLMQQPRHRSP